MMKFLLTLSMFLLLAVPSQALEILPPEIPERAAGSMPKETQSFTDGILELLQTGIYYLRPELRSGLKSVLTLLAAVICISMLSTVSESGKRTAILAGTLSISLLLLNHADSMIRLGTETVRELSSYGKLLLPVMTTAMAAQGNVASSTALYLGTAAFDTILGSLISGMLIPMVYGYIGLSVAHSALQEEMLKQLRDLIRNCLAWCLKTLLIVYTTYMSISGVISGTTDAAALKATRFTIASVVPVVGGILSDASESVLVSVALMKNAAGIYGILAVLAIVIQPFVRIGVQYLLLKAAAAVSNLFSPKAISALIDDFASAMGFLLGMTGSVCLLILISTVCFMKGIG